MQVKGLVEAPSSQAPARADRVRGSGQSSGTDAPTGTAVDDERLKTMVKDANTTLAAKRSELQFVIEGKPRQLVVKLVDKESKQVLRQFPSEEMIAVARNLDRLNSIAVRSVA